MLIKLLILAGGRSVRFGTDKPLALLAGRPLIAHVLEHLSGFPVAIAGGPHVARFAGYGVPLLDDGSFAGMGPLAGLYAGLRWAADAEVLISVPCDTPFLPPDLIPRLLPAPAFARAGGRDHFLAASWPVSAAPRLESILREGGSLKVARFTQALNARAVEFPDDGKVFANINRPEDLAALAGKCCGNITTHNNPLTARGLWAISRASIRLGCDL